MGIQLADLNTVTLKIKHVTVQDHLLNVFLSVRHVRKGHVKMIGCI